MFVDVLLLLALNLATTWLSPRISSLYDGTVTPMPNLPSLVILALSAVEPDAEVKNLIPDAPTPVIPAPDELPENIACIVPLDAIS